MADEKEVTTKLFKKQREERDGTGVEAHNKLNSLVKVWGTGASQYIKAGEEQMVSPVMADKLEKAGKVTKTRPAGATKAKKA